jgi:hypothetical protein
MAGPAAMDPSSPTATPLLWKNARPAELVVDGPMNATCRYSGFDTPIASSSARVGRRFSANCAGLKPPIEVMKPPAGMRLARSR